MSVYYDSNKTKAYAELHIWGEKIVPTEITDILRISPTSSNVVGELWELGEKPYTVATWEFITEEKPLKEDVTEPLNDLIEVFKERTDDLNMIKQQNNDCTITVHIVVHNDQEVLPGFSISIEQIRFLASIGTGIDYDIYNN